MLVSFCGALASGCSGNLDQVTQVKDLRVLAIQADPPEVFADSVLAIPPDQNPTVATVHFRALVVDPRGGPLTYTWSFCPVESNNACHDFDALVADADSALQPGLKALHDAANDLAGTAALVPDAQSFDAATRRQHTVWPFAVPDYPVGLDANLARYHAFDNLFFGFMQGAWPSAILQVAGHGDSLEVQKRVVLNIQDPATLIDGLLAVAPPEVRSQLAAMNICPPPGSTRQATPDCVQLKPRVANHNPVFGPLEAAAGNQAAAHFTPVQVLPLQLAAGRAMRLRPTFTPDSFEPYQVIQADLQTRQLTVRDTTESISVAWYATAGKLQDALTWPLFTKTLDTVYTAPKTPPKANHGQVTIWMVARDGRGGVAWQSIDVQICPAGGPCPSGPTWPAP